MLISPSCKGPLIIINFFLENPSNFFRKVLGRLTLIDIRYEIVRWRICNGDGKYFSQNGVFDNNPPTISKVLRDFKKLIIMSGP